MLRPLALTVTLTAKKPCLSGCCIVPPARCVSSQVRRPTLTLARTFRSFIVVRLPLVVQRRGRLHHERQRNKQRKSTQQTDLVLLFIRRTWWRRRRRISRPASSATSVRLHRGSGLPSGASGIASGPPCVAPRRGGAHHSRWERAGAEVCPPLSPFRAVSPHIISHHIR